MWNSIQSISLLWAVYAMFNVDDYAYSIRYECIIVSLTWYLIDFIKGLFLIINPSDNIILFNRFS